MDGWRAIPGPPVCGSCQITPGMVELEEVLIVVAANNAGQDAALHQLRAQVFDLELQAEWRRLMRARHYLTTDCLVEPANSPWSRLYESGTDLNFINITSLTRAAFHQLLARFSLFYAIPPPSRAGGRPRKVRYHHQVLGILLNFYVSSGDQSALSLLFGVTPTTISRVLEEAEFAMSQALTDYRPARVAWPSPARQVELAKLVAAREPSLRHTFGFIDGKNFRVQEPCQSDLQNAMYNGWLHSVYVTGTLCFAADGCIIWCRHNCPGSWNDSDTSAGFRDKLVNQALCPDQRYGVVSDSAFPCSGDMIGRILTPMKEGDLEKILPSKRSTARRLHNAITSIRQAAEWGMGSVEKVYHRLRLPLPYNPDRRRLRLNNILRLCNYRVRTVGISQIRTVFAGSMNLPGAQENDE